MSTMTESALDQGHLERPVAGGRTEHPRLVGMVDRLRSRKWALVAAAAVLVTGMAYMLAFEHFYYHSKHWSWETGGDLWGIFRGAHFVGWGYLGGVYSGNGVVSFPGMEVLLAPVAMLSGALHLSESFSPDFLPRPTAALLLQPVELLLAGTVIFATDALAERLGITRGRRIALCFGVASVAWPVTAIWGHAEDVLAMTFAVYALIAILDGRWSRAGWLLGFGIVMQPLVGLLLPLAISASPTGQRLMVAVRSAALSVVLVGVAFIGNPGDTFTALIKQPTPFGPNHPTPWAALSPRLSSPTLHSGSPVSPVTLVHVGGRLRLSIIPGHLPTSVVVSGGAGRIIDVLFAVLVGVFVWRRPQDPSRLMWLATVVLASRCFFEPVMTPYYLGPPLILALVMVARTDWRRFCAALIVIGEISFFSYRHLSPWRWWLPVVAGLIGVVALGYPKRPVAEPEVALIPARVVPDLQAMDVELEGSDRTLEPAL
jgi:hypothetical protein